jgi:hypothetical protein
MGSSICCKFCGNPVDPGGWYLTGYYGIIGYVCCSCYRIVARDSAGELENPKEYLMFLLKYGDKLG